MVVNLSSIAAFATSLVLALVPLAMADGVDSAAQKAALELVSRARASESYLVDQRLLNRGKLEEISKFEFHRKGDSVYLSKVTPLRGFERRERLGKSILLVNDFAAYQVARHPDASDFQVTSAAPKSQLVFFVGESGMHFDCIACMPDWVVEWIIGPALRGEDGTKLLTFEKTDNGFHGLIECDLSVVGSAGMQERKQIEFWMNAPGNVTHWKYPYRSEHPNAFVDFEIDWSSDDHYRSTRQILFDGESVVAEWSSIVSEYSTTSPSDEQFSLEQFGLKSPRKSLSILWVIVFVVIIISGAYRLKQRKR